MARPLHESLRVAAAESPDRVALIDGERRVTYAQLWRDASAFGASLIDDGLRSGDRVAVILPNSVEFVVAYYGTLLAGGVVVPLNIAGQQSELATWLSHSEAGWAIHEASNTEATAALRTIDQAIRAEVIGLSGSEAPTWLRNPVSGAFEPLPNRSDQLTCILYTSGTTGRPKGVMLSGGNLASNTEAIVSYLELQNQDIGLGMLPFSYSYGSSVLHTHIAAAATLVISRSFAYPHSVVDLISRERVTGFAGVPSTYALLLSRVSLQNYDLSSLRYLTQAGGPMSGSLQQRLGEALPGRRIYIMYGQTEATARLTYLPPARRSEKLGSVGIPIPGVRIELRDERGIAVPGGERGEVWVAGPNVMLGYWRDKDASRAVLQDGWLKTGDIGSLDEDGFLYLHGRRSDIIKVGEQSVLPGEIEEVIATLPDVAEVAVVGVEDDVLGQAIAAFVVPAESRSPNSHEIRKYCRRKLAAYKVPKHVEFVDALPKTNSGKVLRRVLSEMKAAPRANGPSETSTHGARRLS